MNIDTRRENGILIVKPKEKNIEAGNSREFKTKVNELINQGVDAVVLNLSEVEFIDSSGLGSLISILKLLATSGGKIVICEARDQAIKVFNLTRLNQVFSIFPSESEAINSLSTLKPTK